MMDQDQGASVPGQATQAPPEAARASSPSGECPSRDFITFTARGGRGEYTVRLKQPVLLYDETPHSAYRAVRARAARHIKRELGLHPCSKLVVEPHDWSDGVDALTDAAVEQVLNAPDAEILASADPNDTLDLRAEIDAAIAKARSAQVSA